MSVPKALTDYMKETVEFTLQDLYKDLNKQETKEMIIKEIFEKCIFARDSSSLSNYIQKYGLNISPRGLEALVKIYENPDSAGVSNINNNEAALESFRKKMKDAVKFQRRVMAKLDSLAKETLGSVARPAAAEPEPAVPPKVVGQTPHYEPKNFEPEPKVPPKAYEAPRIPSAALAQNTGAKEKAPHVIFSTGDIVGGRTGGFVFEKPEAVRFGNRGNIIVGDKIEITNDLVRGNVIHYGAYSLRLPSGIRIDQGKVFFNEILQFDSGNPRATFDVKNNTVFYNQRQVFDLETYRKQKPQAFAQETDEQMTARLQREEEIDALAQALAASELEVAQAQEYIARELELAQAKAAQASHQTVQPQSVGSTSQKIKLGTGQSYNLPPNSSNISISGGTGCIVIIGANSSYIEIQGGTGNNLRVLDNCHNMNIKLGTGSQLVIGNYCENITIKSGIGSMCQVGANGRNITLDGRQV